MLPDRVSRLLTAYVDGELETPQHNVVARWLRRSAEARELLHRLEQDAASLSSLPRQSLGQDFAEQLLKIIARRQAESARPSTRAISSYLPGWTGLAAAAATLLAVGLGAYFHFTANRPRQSEPLAVNIPKAGPSVPAEETVRPQDPAPAFAKSDARELLGPPAPQSEANSARSPALPPTAKTPRPAGPRQMLLARPVENRVAPLIDADEPIQPIFDFRELSQQKAPQQLQRALQKTDSHWIDLRCSDPLAGIERLCDAFRAQGIHCIIDQDAQAALKLGMGSGTPFALYCEDLTAHEVVMVLQQLSKRNRQGFDRLEVSDMPWENGRKLSYHLGIDSDQWNVPKTRAAKPGKMDQPTVGRAFVIAYTPGRPRPKSEEMKRFLDSRSERPSDAIRVFLVLRSTKG
jgi:hypothetical protein